jgi:hypothetical protein
MACVRTPLGAEGDLLGLNDSERVVVIPEGVVSRACLSLELGDRCPLP